MAGKLDWTTALGQASVNQSTEQLVGGNPKALPLRTLRWGRLVRRLGMLGNGKQRTNTPTSTRQGPQGIASRLGGGHAPRGVLSGKRGLGRFFHSNLAATAGTQRSADSPGIAYGRCSRSSHCAARFPSQGHGHRVHQHESGRPRTVESALEGAFSRSRKVRNCPRGA
jgi:hypothetical protein